MAGASSGRDRGDDKYCWQLNLCCGRRKKDIKTLLFAISSRLSNLCDAIVGQNASQPQPKGHEAGACKINELQPFEVCIISALTGLNVKQQSIFISLGHIHD